MKLIITGGTGFLGTLLSSKLTEQGHSVTAVARNRGPLSPGCDFIQADTTQEGEWMNAISAHDGVINLAGATVFQRWSSRAKQAIRDSRVLTTKNIVSAIKKNPGSLRRLISASAVGYYGFTGDRMITEDDPPGKDFLAGVASEWESAALEAQSHGINTSVCRFGIILGSGGGALSSMLPVFKLNLGARLGSGAQWFPWIHIEDLAGIISHLLNNPGITGPVNCTAPGMITNGYFTKRLAEALGRKIILPPIPRFMIKIIYGEAGEMLIEGQRVSSEKIVSSGYRFIYPDIVKALGSLQ